MEDVLYFTRCKIQRVAAYNFFFFIHSAITQSKDFPLGSLTEGKKTIYHWKKRKMEDALYFTLLDVKSKELLYNFFHFFFFAYIHTIERFSSLTKGKKIIYHRNGKKEKWKTAFTLFDVKSKELLRIISSSLFFLHTFTQSKDFPLRSLTEGKKTIYHWKKRKI